MRAGLSGRRPAVAASRRPVAVGVAGVGLVAGPAPAAPPTRLLLPDPDPATARPTRHRTRAQSLPPRIIHHISHQLEAGPRPRTSMGRAGASGTGWGWRGGAGEGGLKKRKTEWQRLHEATSGIPPTGPPLGTSALWMAKGREGGDLGQGFLGFLPGRGIGAFFGHGVGGGAGLRRRWRCWLRHRNRTQVQVHPTSTLSVIHF